MKPYYDRNEMKCVYELPPDTESNYSNSEYDSELDKDLENYSLITKIVSNHDDNTEITNGSTEIMSRAPESFNINERQTRRSRILRTPKNIVINNIADRNLNH